MSPETEQLLQDLRSADATIREAAIEQLAQPIHHAAIPILIDWLLDDTIVAVEDLVVIVDEYPLNHEALRVLTKIGEAAVPEMLAWLKAHGVMKNALLMMALEKLPIADLTPLIAHYRFFLLHDEVYAKRIRRTIEAHNPRIALVTADMVPDMLATLKESPQPRPELLNELKPFLRSSMVASLVAHYRVAYWGAGVINEHYYGHKRLPYYDDLLALIRQHGQAQDVRVATRPTPKSVAQLSIRWGLLLLALVPIVLIVVGMGSVLLFLGLFTVVASFLGIVFQVFFGKCRTRSNQYNSRSARAYRRK